MAGKAVDMMVGKLIDVREIFQRINADELAEVLTPAIGQKSDHHCSCFQNFFVLILFGS